MFLDRSRGGEFEPGVASAPDASNGIRRLGLNERVDGGVLALPVLSPDIPLELNRADLAVAGLARFMCLADRYGIKLPTAKFTTLADALAQQFQDYADKRTQHLAHKLPYSITIRAEDLRIVLAGEAVPNLSVFLLKEPIERINAASPGLGWFVTDVIAGAHQNGMTLYEPSRLSYLASHCWFRDHEVDSEFVADALNDYLEPGESAVDSQKLTDEDWTKFRERHYGGPMPSDFLVEFDGHANLIGWTHHRPDGDSPRAPAKVKAKSVPELLKKVSLQDSDRRLVEAALRYHRLMRSVRTKQFTWEDWRSGFIDEDWREGIGALGFVVWNSMELVGELVEHFEQEAYNGGEATEEIFSMAVELDEEATWPRIITAYKLVIDSYVALSELLGLLPRME